MQDRPTAAELLDAVASFLADDVMDEMSGRKKFHVRVAVNVLRTIERELGAEEDAVRAEAGRLERLLGDRGPVPATFAGLRDHVDAANTELAAAIRRGEFDDRWDELLAALRETVSEKLAIANPDWA